MRCDRGHDNATGAAFCGVCGQQLVVREQAQPVGVDQSYLEPQPVQPDLGDVALPPAKRGGIPVIAWILGGVAAFVLLAVIGVAVVRSAVPSTTTMTVTLSVFTDDFRGCDLGWGYADVPGSSVVVRTDGKIVGTGSLGSIGEEEVISCNFTALIRDVPTDGDYYTIEIGRRGTGDATQSELEGNDWTYQATLGL